ncbi:MAG: hypothetical protein ACON35_01110 [Candidatus Marinamargulisbacteria bacterium]
MKFNKIGNEPKTDPIKTNQNLISNMGIPVIKKNFMAIAKLVKSKMRGLSVLLNRNVSNNASQACRTNETDKALSNANAQESAPAENAPNNAIAKEGVLADIALSNANAQEGAPAENAPNNAIAKEGVLADKASSNVSEKEGGGISHISTEEQGRDVIEIDGPLTDDKNKDESDQMLVKTFDHLMNKKQLGELTDEDKGKFEQVLSEIYDYLMDKKRSGELTDDDKSKFEQVLTEIYYHLVDRISSGTLTDKDVELAIGLFENDRETTKDNFASIITFKTIDGVTENDVKIAKFLIENDESGISKEEFTDLVVYRIENNLLTDNDVAIAELLIDDSLEYINIENKFYSAATKKLESGHKLTENECKIATLLYFYDESEDENIYEIKEAAQDWCNDTHAAIMVRTMASKLADDEVENAIDDVKNAKFLIKHNLSGSSFAFTITEKLQLGHQLTDNDVEIAKFLIEINESGNIVSTFVDAITEKLRSAHQLTDNDLEIANFLIENDKSGKFKDQLAAMVTTKLDQKAARDLLI